MKALLFIGWIFCEAVWATPVDLVSIDATEKKRHLCKGVVLQPGYVMTAAHCLRNQKDGGVWIADRPEKPSRKAHLSKVEFVGGAFGSPHEDIAILEIDTEGREGVKIFSVGEDGKRLPVGSKIKYQPGPSAYARTEKILDYVYRENSSSLNPNVLQATNDHGAVHGVSGSPVYTTGGELLGILSGGAPTDIAISLADGDSGREARQSAFGGETAKPGTFNASEFYVSGSVSCALTFVEPKIAVTSAHCLGTTKTPELRLVRGGSKAENFFFSFPEGAEIPAHEDFAFVTFAFDNHRVSKVGTDHRVDSTRDQWKVHTYAGGTALLTDSALPVSPIYSGKGGAPLLINVGATKAKQVGQLFADDGTVIGTLNGCNGTLCQYTSIFSTKALEVLRRARESLKP